VIGALFEVMAAQHGVASSAQARVAGIDSHAEDVLVRRGVIRRSAAGVLVSPAAPRTWHQRAMEAVFAPGRAVLSHGAAARLHGLDGFDGYDSVDVLCRKGWWPDPPAGTITHFTRGLTDTCDVTTVDSLCVLTVPATLALLAPAAGLGPTARALDGALRLGHDPDGLREVANRWKRRGRPGPPTLLMLLDERDGRRLPRSWFQRLAKRILERSGIRLVDEHRVHDERGVLVAELDLAEPRRKIGIECQSWRWHGSPDAQHRDARRRGVLRALGWEIIDVWWRDLDHPDRILAELHHLLTTRPVCAR
jgi:very-short-patch-repair endonuclease